MSADWLLTEAEREALEDAAGCGCCSAMYNAEKLWPDDCPVDDGGVPDHAYNDACVQMASLGDLVNRILADRLARVSS
jgi:hypothetical protein